MPDLPVTAANREVAPAHNSPAIVADPTDPSFVVLAYRRDAPFDCGLELSGNGGRGWVPAQPVPELPEGADTCYAPEVAFDADGTLYYLFVGLAGEGNEPMGAFLTTSDDRGRTFSPPWPVLGPRNFAVRLAVEPATGRVHLVWLSTASDPPLGGFGPGPNPILTASSDDGGRTFSSPLQVSSPARSRVVAPALALGPDDAIHVGFYDLGDDARDYQGLQGPAWDGTWSLVTATSLDGGRTFGPEVVVDDGVVPTERVMLVFTMPPPALVALDGGGVCAAWTDGRNGDPDALLRCSSGPTGGWGEVRRLNDDPVGNGRSQFQPRLGAAPDGRIDAVFYDRRLDPQNRLNDVFLTSSYDDGVTFTRNLRLSRESSNSQLGPQYAVPSAEGLVEFGSRLGLLSARAGAVAAWTDTRNGAQGKPGQDIFATAVRYGDGGWNWATRLLWAGVAVALVALSVLIIRRRGNGTRRSSTSAPDQRRRRPAGGAMVALACGVACTPSGTAASSWPPVPPTVTVTMNEFTFGYDRAIPAGRVVFDVRNQGALEHELQFFALSDEIPPIDEQLRGAERRIIPPLGGVPHREPGESGTFAVDLAAGQRYALICFLSDNGRQHTLDGMSSEFRAQGPPPGAGR